MAGSNILAVVLEDGLESRLRYAIAHRPGETPRVHVVAPRRVGLLQWYATDEEAARAEAADRALEAEAALTDEADVDSDEGEADPVQAVEDALESFSADEILVVGGAEDGEFVASLRRLGLPVSQVPGKPFASGLSRLRGAARGIVSGRSNATPFVVVAGVNLVLLVLSGVIALTVIIVLLLL